MPPTGLAPSATTTMLNRAPQLLALADALGDLLEVERDLRDQDDVGAAGDAGVERNPAGVAAHHLDHHDAVVRLGGRVQPVDGVGGEARPPCRSRSVFVVSTMSLSMVLGTPTSGMPRLVELVGDRERAVAADHDQRVELQLVEHLDARARNSRACRRASRSGYANGLPRLVVPRIVPPMPRMPVTSRGVSGRERSGSMQAVEAVLEADDLAAGVGRRLDDGADDRVQARGVAAAGQDADACERWADETSGEYSSVVARLSRSA